MWMTRKQNAPLVHWAFSTHSPQRLRVPGSVLIRTLPNCLQTDTSGQETVLHSFNGTDGAQLAAGLILDGAGNLYMARLLVVQQLLERCSNLTQRARTFQRYIPFQGR